MQWAPCPPGFSARISRVYYCNYCLPAPVWIALRNNASFVSSARRGGRAAEVPMAGRWRRVQQLLACACCCHHWTRGSAAPPTVPDDFWPAAPPSPRVTPRAGAPRPHIILHVTDDQGWANVGYHNEGHVLTPTMDRLATKEGVRLERHYAFQWCAPSRAALLTGRESYHVLAQGGGGGDLPAAVTRGMTMLPKKLQSVGYTTHQIGKW